MTLNEQIWLLLAGLGLFLFGMFQLEEGLKKLAGRSFKLFLRNQTNRTYKAILSGALVTALLQSSSLVTLLVMSFAGSGLIGLSSGIGLIMGANIGTTATGWLVTLVGFKLDINAMILPFVAVGGLGLAFLKSEKLAAFSKMLMGLSLLFMGLGFMKDAFSELTTSIDFSFLVGKPSILFVLFGAFLTALIQSSSAAVTLFLSALATGILTLDQGVYLVIGSNIGSTVTGLISLFGANTVKKRVGWSQFFFNVFTAIVALVFSSLILKGIHFLFDGKNELSTLVLFHTAFNVLGVLLVWPFINRFTAFIEWIVPEKAEKLTTYLPDKEHIESISGGEALKKEVPLFIKEALNLNQNVFEKGSVNGKDFLENYHQLKDYEAEINQFIFSLQGTELQTQEAVDLQKLTAAVRNASLSAKDMKDSFHNWLTLREIEDESEIVIKRQIEDNQRLFYRDLNLLFERPESFSETELEQLDQVQNDFFRQETDLLYKMQTKSSFDLVSGLNMLREINSSNSSLVRAVRHYFGV